MATDDVRTYRLQLLAMLSTAGRRPRLDQPVRTQAGVSLHRCGLFLPVRARSSGAAVQMFEKAATDADMSAAWTRAFHGPQHHGRWPKPGDVVLVDGQPEWQRAVDGYRRIPAEQYRRVTALIDPRSWRDTLCPLDAAIERGRQLVGLVDVHLTQTELHALRHVLTNTASRPPHDTTLLSVERQSMARQRRPGGLTGGVMLRLDYGNLHDIRHALLNGATAHEHHPSTPSAVRADGLRTLLRTIQSQAAGQTIGPPRLSAPDDLGLAL